MFPLRPARAQVLALIYIGDVLQDMWAELKEEIRKDAERYQP